MRGLVTLQVLILDQTAAMVRPGGALAYMTCSLLRVENQSQTEAFRQRNPDFEFGRTAAVHAA